MARDLRGIGFTRIVRRGRDGACTPHPIRKLTGLATEVELEHNFIFWFDLGPASY
jgi:hypothetical protein